jgi:hypothetical protein
MTPLQQALLLCFVVYPLVVVIQSLWIIWLVWFSRRRRVSHHQTFRRSSQRGLWHNHLPPRTTTPTLVQMTMGDEAAELPAQRSEVNAL